MNDNRRSGDSSTGGDCGSELTGSGGAFEIRELSSARRLAIAMQLQSGFYETADVRDVVATRILSEFSDGGPQA